MRSSWKYTALNTLRDLSILGWVATERQTSRQVCPSGLAIAGEISDTGRNSLSGGAHDFKPTGTAFKSGSRIVIEVYGSPACEITYYENRLSEVAYLDGPKQQTGTKVLLYKSMASAVDSNIWVAEPPLVVLAPKSSRLTTLEGITQNRCEILPSR